MFPLRVFFKCDGGGFWAIGCSGGRRYFKRSDFSATAALDSAKKSLMSRRGPRDLPEAEKVVDFFVARHWGDVLNVNRVRHDGLD